MKRKRYSVPDLPPSPSPSPSPSPPSPRRSAHATRALQRELDPLLPDFEIDKSHEIDAAILRKFDLSQTFKDALKLSKENKHRLHPGEKDPKMFDFFHIAALLKLPQQSGAQQPLSSDEGSDAAKPTKKKPRKKRAQSDKIKWAVRCAIKLRGGADRNGGEAPEVDAQLKRQLRHNVENSEVFEPFRFSVITDTSVASTGRRGRRMPKAELQRWRSDYNKNKINDIVAKFVPVRFSG